LSARSTRQRGFGGVCLLVLICAAAPGWAASELPPYVTFPAQVTVNMDTLVAEDYCEAEFSVPGRDQPLVKRGRHWHVEIAVSGIPGGTPGKAIREQLKPTILQSGWTTLLEDGPRMDLVEIGPPTLKLTLKPPTPKPEQVSADSGDFPYLMPVPGSTAGDSSHEDGPMLVAVGQNTDEQQVVGSGSLKKFYSPPAGLSPLLFATARHAALTAHYAANGRDLWADLHLGGDGYLLQVADAGTVDVGKNLDRDCHVALCGVNFDFNKAILRPDPVPQKVLALVNARTDLMPEIHGHTDNLGRAKNRRVELKKQGCGK
jgi:OOP family OmpA-OmpF porin